MEKFSIENVYVCNFCGKAYESEEMIERHLKECLLNMEDNHTCIGCKHCVINQVPPTSSKRGYQSLRLQELLGNKNFISCGNDVYNGKIGEEIVLREDKKCFEVAEFGSDFETKQTDEYVKYLEIMNDIDIEQSEIADEIEQLKKDAIELSEEEFDDKYKDN